jgi:hypothetical protein
MTDGTKAFAAALCLTLGLTLEWAIYPAPAVARTGTPSGLIIIVYRDAVSNVRQLKGTAHYQGFLGRDPTVSFHVTNEQGEQACTGTFTTQSQRAGEFSLRCFDGQFSGNGNYERKAGDRIDSFIARGRTAQGLPIMLVVGKPAGISEDQFLSP